MHSFEDCRVGTRGGGHGGFMTQNRPRPARALTRSMTDDRACVFVFRRRCRRGVLDMSRWGHRGTRGTTKTRAFASRVDVGDVASNRDDMMMPRSIARRDGTTENAREPPNLREDAFEIF